MMHIQQVHSLGRLQSWFSLCLGKLQPMKKPSASSSQPVYTWFLDPSQDVTGVMTNNPVTTLFIASKLKLF
ncbi:hypothetical protein llap_6617 [Limosa lapponica baueri]|uniref:Uncharacterized protein n=1 Tax=Limosa lapponica baueri TaxID=1758121 RepID=A0A2I0UAQ6_LIMLA|nr:hypothetical protein llap_6617 [Limosa lapponica baueri]